MLARRTILSASKLSANFARSLSSLQTSSFPAYSSAPIRRHFSTLAEINNQTLTDSANVTISPEIKSLTDELQANFMTFQTHDIEFRKTQLKKLIQGCQELEGEFIEAFAKDLKNHPEDTIICNIGAIIGECEVALANLDSWAAFKPVQTIEVFQPVNSGYRYEPLGVVLVISAWNYSLATSGAIVSGIAAGNCVICKPSEFSPEVSKVMAKLFSNYLDNRFYRLVEGGAEATTQLIATGLQQITFTGSTTVGKIIAKQAAEHLTPCVLELGGLCPAVVDKDADMTVTARAIAQGKMQNCGQTCTAPNFFYVHKDVKEDLIKAIIPALEETYGPDFYTNERYSRVINPTHAQRIKSLLEDSQDRIIYGNLDEVKVDESYLPPFIVDEPRDSSELMCNEVFGPIISIKTYEDLRIEVIDRINAGSTPLQIYYFGDENHQNCKDLQLMTRSGNFMTNETLVNFGMIELPFGGVGGSGYGQTKTIHGFKAMSNPRTYAMRPRSY